MRDERNNGYLPACNSQEESGEEAASRGTRAFCGCACGAPQDRRSWIKTLISAAIIAAAMGVGVYSLWFNAGGTEESASKNAVIPAVAPVDTVAAGASSAPDIERPCGCGEAARPEAVESGRAIPGAPQAECGGEQKPGCCGH